MKDAPVDLDLRLETPSGVIVGTRNINSFVRPVDGPPPMDAWKQGGWLQFDSNRNCRLDLRNVEDIVWLAADPPPGVYRVYAQLYSGCGAASANLVASVQLHGEEIDRVGATVYEFDAREHPEPGEVPGLLLSEFRVPSPFEAE